MHCTNSLERENHGYSIHLKHESIQLLKFIGLNIKLYKYIAWKIKLDSAVSELGDFVGCRKIKAFCRFLTWYMNLKMSVFSKQLYFFFPSSINVHV